MSVLLVTRDSELEERCRRAVSAEHQFEIVDSIPELLKAAKPAIVLLDALALEKPFDRHVANVVTTLVSARVIVMTPEFNEDEEILLLKSGVKGVCRRGVDPESLRQVLSATEGGVWVSRSLLPRLVTELRRYADAHRPPTPAEQAPARPVRATVGKLPPDEFDALTPREQEILRLIADGATNKEAGAQLDISERTVKGHLSNVFQKLGVPDRMKLLMYLRDGKIDS